MHLVNGGREQPERPMLPAMRNTNQISLAACEKTSIALSHRQGTSYTSSPLQNRKDSLYEIPISHLS
jgi:hypothetical protein